MLVPSCHRHAQARGRRSNRTYGAVPALCERQSAQRYATDRVKQRYPPTLVCPKPSNTDSCWHRFDEYLPSFLHMPSYFDKYGAREPSGRLHSIKASAEGHPELTATEIMYAQPERVANMALA